MSDVRRARAASLTGCGALVRAAAIVVFGLGVLGMSTRSRGVTADEVLVARDLGRGRAEHDFEVTSSCPLARVELDLEVESMPDGTVTLTSPTGRTQRLSLHVLTSTHFVRTWDWQLLPALHGLRGDPANGRWQLSIRASGARYQGGAQPHASDMPTPSFPRAELRVFCEPGHAPATGGRIDARVPVVHEPVRSGANVRALVPVSSECTIGSLTVSLEERWERESGASLTLVSPAGRRIRLEPARPMTTGPHATHTRDVVAVHGQPSHGLWEIVRTRASGSVMIDEAAIQIDCAP